MTTRRRLAACLLVCCLVALAPVSAGLPAAKPSPEELWKLYPLDATGRGKGEHRAAPTKPDRQPSPRSGVAGASTTRQEGTGSTGATVARDDDSEDGGTALWLGLVLGGLVAAVLMLGVAALPERAIPRRGAMLVDRRLDLAFSGVLALVVVTIVYLASGA